MTGTRAGAQGGTLFILRWRAVRFYLFIFCFLISYYPFIPNPHPLPYPSYTSVESKVGQMAKAVHEAPM